MLELIKKAVYLGLGVLEATREKAENIVDELIKKGEVKSENRNDVVEELVNKAREIEAGINKKIREQVENVIAGLGIPSKKDLEELSGKIDALNKKLGSAGKK